MPKTTLRIEGPTIYAPNTLLKNGQITLAGEKISALEENTFSNSDTKLQFPSTYHLIPGMIDMHIHGTNGADVMDGTVAALNTLVTQLPREGTTAFLATTMSESKAVIEQALSNVATFKALNASAEILGIHLEGPFLSPKRTGAQSASALLTPDISLMSQWQTISDHKIKLVTLAPELENAEAFIHHLCEHHIIAAIGHTDANYDQTRYAIQCGCTHATHLFNAMPGMHHRLPGPIPAILESNQVIAELIADGQHVHPRMINLTYQLKGANQLVLVTDAMRAKCHPDGIYMLGGQSVTVKNGTATLENGTLAGSTLPMHQALKNMLVYTGQTLQELLPLVTTNPARSLGLSNRKGQLEPGKDADLVVLDENYDVALTVCRGEIAYQRGA